MSAYKPVKRNRTAREIAEKLGVSARTVRRYIAQPRIEYEANSLTKSKPWEALGLSRATWYRHGKPKAFEVSEA
jgi:predicted transcriptional regulator